MSMANNLLGILLFLILSVYSAPSKAQTPEEAQVQAELSPIATTEAQPAAPPPAPKCTQQLEQGYALRERIDNEYRQSRRAGTFLGRKDAFTARWGKEAAEWAAETRAILLQIGGPTAKGRFLSAATPIGMVGGDVKWNNVRNFLRTRLAALASICKAP